MCGPAIVVAGVAAAASVGSAVASHHAQKKANEANEEAARQAYLGNLKNAAALEVENRDLTARNIFTATRQARQARSFARASAGESGVAGASVSALQQSITADLGEVTVQERKNLDRALGQIQRDRETGKDVMDQRIAAVPPPNPFVTSLNIVRGLSEAASTYRNMNAIQTG